MFRAAKQPEGCQRGAMQHRNKVARSFHRFTETANCSNPLFWAVPKGKCCAFFRESRTHFSWNCSGWSTPKVRGRLGL